MLVNHHHYHHFLNRRPSQGLSFPLRFAVRFVLAWVGDADCGPGGKARRQKDLEEISAPEGYEIVGLQFADNGKQCPPIEKLLLRVVNKVAPQ